MIHRILQFISDLLEEIPHINQPVYKENALNFVEFQFIILAIPIRLCVKVSYLKMLQFTPSFQILLSLKIQTASVKLLVHYQHKYGLEQLFGNAAMRKLRIKSMAISIELNLKFRG